MGTERRSYIDWLRGLAILIMIEAHVLDAWTRTDVRASAEFGWAMVLGGFAAPGFLFLAGVASVLALTARRARAGGDAAAARTIRRRGWEIFGLAFLFRLQSFVLNPGAPAAGLLKVDILNIMGPAIVLSGAVLGIIRRQSYRMLAFAAIAGAFTFLTPIVRIAPWLSWLPDPIEWYVRPQPGRTTFTLFPWAGFLFAGSFVGMLVDRARSRRADVLFHAALIGAGAAVAVAAYAASFLPPIYRQSNFWTTSPTFFFLRVGILIAAVGLARFWSLRPRLTPVGRFGPMERFGRSSLFVYWIHVEMAYGWMSSPLHKSLTMPQVAVAFAVFTGLLFVLVLVKRSIVAARRARRVGKTASPEAGATRVR